MALSEGEEAEAEEETGGEGLEEPEKEEDDVCGVITYISLSHNQVCLHYTHTCLVVHLK